MLGLFFLWFRKKNSLVCSLSNVIRLWRCDVWRLSIRNEKYHPTFHFRTFAEFAHVNTDDVEEHCGSPWSYLFNIFTLLLLIHWACSLVISPRVVCLKYIGRIKNIQVTAGSTKRPRHKGGTTILFYFRRLAPCRVHISPLFTSKIAKRSHNRSSVFYRAVQSDEGRKRSRSARPSSR